VKATVEKIAKDLCVDERLTPNSAAALEASSCPECKTDAIKKSTGLAQTEAAASQLGGLAKLAATGSEEDRIKRDLAFLEYFVGRNMHKHHDNKYATPERVQRALHYLKLDLIDFAKQVETSRDSRDQHQKEVALLERILAGAEFPAGNAKLSKRIRDFAADLSREASDRRRSLDLAHRVLREYEDILAKMNSAKTNWYREQEPGGDETDSRTYDRKDVETTIAKYRGDVVPNAAKEFNAFEQKREGLATWREWMNDPVGPRPSLAALKPLLEDSRAHVELHARELAKVEAIVADIKKEIPYLEARLAAFETGPPTARPGYPQRLADLEFQLESMARKFRTCGLSIAEAIAVMSYTSNGYVLLNGALREGGAVANAAKPYKDAIEAALRKIKPYKGIVNRGVTMPEARIEQHKPGAIVTYPGFTSTSIGEGFGHKPHRIVIVSHTGRYVDFHSSAAGEREVLFRAGTKFKVLSREEGIDDRLTIVMEEVE
jgi:hypothetical protein